MHIARRAIMLVLVALGAGRNSASIGGPDHATLSGGGAVGLHELPRGIELIREPDSQMMQQIMARGRSSGDPAGCVVCHGGDPNETAGRSHRARWPVAGRLLSGPGQPLDQRADLRPVPSTTRRRAVDQPDDDRGGQDPGRLLGLRSLTGYEHRWANYAVAESRRIPAIAWARDAYRAYMRTAEADRAQRVCRRPRTACPRRCKVDELDRLHEDPTLAAFTYIRQECQRCHHAVKGRQARGDYRGIGCSSCHTPYSNEGFLRGRRPDDRSSRPPGTCWCTRSRARARRRSPCTTRPTAASRWRPAPPATIAASGSASRSRD